MRVALLLLTILTLASQIVGRAAAEEQKPAAPLPKVAVLHLDEVIRAAKIYTTRIDVLKKEKTDAESQIKLMDEQLQQLDNSLQALSPSNERFAKLSEDFETLKVRRKMSMERARTDLDHRHAALLKSCFETLRDLLAKFSKENGIMMVHLVPNSDLQTTNTSEIQLQMGLQSLLYYDPSLDVTAPFIAYVNSHFVASAPSGDAPAPASVATPTFGPAPTPLPAPAGAAGQPTGK
jgi:Skp family chaperone for outer membrane proteins